MGRFGTSWENSRVKSMLRQGLMYCTSGNLCWPNLLLRDKLPTRNEHGGAGMATVGSGAYIYEPVENWAKLPPGWSFKEIGGVGVDRHDNVFVFNRGEHPMIVFDCDGNFLRSFGEGMFPRAHGVFMAPDDTIWLTDDGDHTVRQCTLEGKVLLTLGISGKPAPFMSGEPFHRCTHTACLRRGTSMCPTAMAIRACTNTRQTASCFSPGAGLVPIRASSTSRTTSPAMLMVGCMWPTARTIACRCSTATASTRPSGTTCTVRAACSCHPASARSATSANSAPCNRGAALCRPWARGSPLSTTRESAFPD